MRSAWFTGGGEIWGNLNANTVKCCKRHTETQRERGEGLMMTEAETKERHPHAREHLEPSEAGGDEEDSLLEKEPGPAGTPNYRLWPPEM